MHRNHCKICALLTIPEVLPRRDLSDVTLVSEDPAKNLCGDASIVVLSLWSENSAKLALFGVHGYSFVFTQIRQKSFVFVRRAHAQIATAWCQPLPVVLDRNQEPPHLQTPAPSKGQSPKSHSFRMDPGKLYVPIDSYIFNMNDTCFCCCFKWYFT
jgi:hypothetical protein